MKKITSILLALLLLLAFAACSGSDTPSPSAGVTGETTPTPTPTPDVSVEVFVSIADENGALALPQASVSVTDKDADGALTINDALICAHEAFCPAGAEGYASGNTDFGVSIFKLWNSNGKTGFGFYLNGQMAFSLSDAVKAGDYLDAYVFTDTVSYSDAYSYFDKRTVSAAVGEEVSLKIVKIGFDESFSPVALNAGEGITILLNGEQTEYATDSEGCVTLTFSAPGTYTVSASSASAEGLTLVPPVCIVTVA